MGSCVETDFLWKSLEHPSQSPVQTSSYSHSFEMGVLACHRASAPPRGTQAPPQLSCLRVPVRLPVRWLDLCTGTPAVCLTFGPRLV